MSSLVTETDGITTKPVYIAGSSMKYCATESAGALSPVRIPQVSSLSNTPMTPKATLNDGDSDEEDDDFKSCTSDPSDAEDDADKDTNQSNKNLGEEVDDSQADSKVLNSWGKLDASKFLLRVGKFTTTIFDIQIWY